MRKFLGVGLSLVGILVGINAVSKWYYTAYYSGQFGFQDSSTTIYFGEAITYTIVAIIFIIIGLRLYRPRKIKQIKEETNAGRYRRTPSSSSTKRVC